MKKYIYSIAFLVCGLMLTGCDRYLDISPKGTQLLKTVDDYDQWLNSDALINGVGQPYGTINFLADNVDVVNISNPPTSAAELLYTWAPQFSMEENVSPMFWGEHYARINLFNTVLLGIEEATGGAQSRIKSLKAEALLGRAFEYFYLLNEYAKPYDANTAATDLAVPFVTSNDVTQTVPARSTVAFLYDQIITDLENALPNLPLDNTANRYRGSKSAAYSVLARIYFYQRDYENALKYAQLSLANTKATMINYNGVLPERDMLSIHPDVIYGRMILGNNTATLDFMKSFASNDLRVRRLYYSTDGYTFKTRGATLFIPAYVTPVLQYVNIGTSVQEMKLIIAEAAARKNDLTLALKELDEVRKNRYNTTYVKFESTDKEQVLIEVLKERSHELAFNGLRWFDMRRLDKENRMDTVYRYNALGEVIATLSPGSDRYTLQIPHQVLSYNPNMVQNP